MELLALISQRRGKCHLCQEESRFSEIPCASESCVLGGTTESHPASGGWSALCVRGSKRRSYDVGPQKRAKWLHEGRGFLWAIHDPGEQGCGLLAEPSLEPSSASLWSPS